PDLAAISRELAGGQAALVRIDLPAESALASPPASARVRPLAGAGSWHDVALLGAAPVSDAQVQGSSFLALWRGAPAAIGTTLRASLAAPGEPEKGLVVPQSALVRYAGGTFVYVPKDKGYEKRVVVVSRVVPQGVVLSSGVGPGDRVVVGGAQQLLASELLGSTAGAQGDSD
ncbi:MAG TPA: hypothetical protein VHC86_00550, partial [Opitutaceae bacterium]|nr:hypothetical protein [Opitutaceae bacterium]